jgi:DUF1009 family protein
MPADGLTTTTPATAPDRRQAPIGLVAGYGRFPILFAEAAQARGLAVACVAIRHEADPALARLCQSFEWNGVSKVGRAIRYCRRWGCRKVVFAGKIHKNVIYTPGRLFQLLPDLRTLHIFYRAAQDRRDDSLTLAIVNEFERDGMRIASALDYCPELLVKPGFLTRRRPTAAEWKDVRFGWTMAKEMGRLDIGQSVAVKDLNTIAVEAIEGTDRCIERAGLLCRAGGWTLVKVAKPQQDMRFDVPTIGVDTITNLRQAGARVLAIEAGRTIILDEPEVLALADRHGIAVVSVTEDEVAA